MFDRQKFHFGLETEFMLADSSTYQPLWYQDVSFKQLNSIFESIPYEDLPSMDGLELEAPHTKLMPYVVEGYHVMDTNFSPIDILPKGVEIRTPVCRSIDECMQTFSVLYRRLQTALAEHGLTAVALSHHPLATQFSGPQNKRRHDYWQWAMEVMTTYGPDINISPPQAVLDAIDWQDFDAKVNYYAPALTALSAASPFYDGKLWRIGGQVGKSYRTFRRSVIAPAIEVHLAEAGRIEFKTFDMSGHCYDYHGYFLLNLLLLLDETLQGRANKPTRIYDLGAVARFGLQAEGVRARLDEVFDHAQVVLPKWGFDPTPLLPFIERTFSGVTPADTLIEDFEREGSFLGVLKRLSQLTSLEDELPLIPPLKSSLPARANL